MRENRSWLEVGYRLFLHVCNAAGVPKMYSNTA